MCSEKSSIFFKHLPVHALKMLIFFIYNAIKKGLPYLGWESDNWTLPLVNIKRDVAQIIISPAHTKNSFLTCTESKLCNPGTGTAVLNQLCCQYRFGFSWIAQCFITERLSAQLSWKHNRGRGHLSDSWASGINTHLQNPPGDRWAASAGCAAETDYSLCTNPCLTSRTQAPAFCTCCIFQGRK